MQSSGLAVSLNMLTHAYLHLCHAVTIEIRDQITTSYLYGQSQLSHNQILTIVAISPFLASEKLFAFFGTWQEGWC